MRRFLRWNRWTNHLGCFALGAALCAGVWAGVGAWHDDDLHDRVSGRWTLEAAHADPAIGQVEADYRPDGSFAIWQIRKDGTGQIVEHGRWWVSGGRLVQEHASHDGRPLPSGTLARPERLTVVRADQTLVLVWPAGFQHQFRRSAELGRSASG